MTPVFNLSEDGGFIEMPNMFCCYFLRRECQDPNALLGGCWWLGSSPSGGIWLKATSSCSCIKHDGASALCLAVGLSRGSRAGCRAKGSQHRGQRAIDYKAVTDINRTRQCHGRVSRVGGR